jgi:predicted Zn-dependent protease
MAFQRVDATAPGAYDFRVTLVSPGSMERYCPGVGTGGYTSCRYGERAVINLARWETAVPHYDGDVATYRQYVVNHEVGHALGNGHRPCPGQGQPAPVMQQQTLGLDGCQRNAWPFP